jgi:hypothetical protein
MSSGDSCPRIGMGSLRLLFSNQPALQRCPLAARSVYAAARAVRTLFSAIV